MLVPLLIAFAALFVVFAALRGRRRADRRREMMQHFISAEALHQLLSMSDKPTVLDIRVPLDFLAHTEMIPGATRIAPNEMIANPKMISKKIEYVLYCTCPGEASSEAVLSAALRMGFYKVKMLTGGIEAWKQKGFPVEPYNRPFHLDAQRKS
ncbi:Rhodanese-related sulfurtransferase [Granulicella sibirica]|uniref:Rhodanese-related sulfurtransferase n=2 Tax=Granulicella sibirica TaxID=2479048 RepID=A0A4V1L5W3_9BACT|nr:Rhodanese-related sulfurtransferase [Granulicella sibirica]